MGLMDRVNAGAKPPVIENTLTLEEVDLLVRVLGTASFPVREIEELYRAIYKLQELRNKLK